MILRPICSSDRVWWSLGGTGRTGGKMGEVCRWIYLDPFPSPAPSLPPYLPGGLPPRLPPFTQLKLTRDRRLPLVATHQKINFINNFKWTFKIRLEEADYYRTVIQGPWHGIIVIDTNYWDRWEKVLIRFSKLPLNQLDYNSSTTVTTIFPKMELEIDFGWLG